MGFESLWLIYNLGSLFLVVLSIPFLMMLLSLLAMCKNRSSTTFHAYKRLDRFLFWNYQIRVIQESYTILIMGCLISSKYIHWHDPTHALNSFLVVFLLLVLLIYPVLILSQLFKYHDQLHKGDFRKAFGSAYEAYATKQRKAFLIFIMLFYLRRILLALVVVYFMR